MFLITLCGGQISPPPWSPRGTPHAHVASHLPVAKQKGCDVGQQGRVNGIVVLRIVIDVY